MPKFQWAVSVGYEREMTAGLEAFSNLTWQHVGERYTQISDQGAEPARRFALFPNIGGDHGHQR